DNLIREYEREKMVAPKERAKQLEIIIRYLKAIKDLPPDGRRAFLLAEIETLQKELEEELAKLSAKCNERIKALEKELESYLKQLMSQAEQDLKKLRERLERLNRLLVLTEEEIEALKRVLPS
ncbi:hypothetical protein J7K74_03860, partial [Candidatus Woesearchaeota archaeon]|nr:hypothetical protein [Candidatus Woesearchaeota archaeon]